ncbi:WD40 repeat-like protein [Ramicandelaber brevisporus]|nr:WD40 repeat-like protein [Ramicandelaber brevisporus]
MTQMTARSVPITAAVYVASDRLLLCSCGSELCVFDAISGRLLATLSEISGFRVNCIVPAPELLTATPQTPTTGQIAISSGKMLRIITMTILISSDSDINVVLRHDDEQYPIALCRDWIHDICWLKSDEDGDVYDELAVAFMHGHVEIRRLDSLSTAQVRVRVEDRCITYCARLIGTSRRTLRVANGTVFNQVLLWDLLDHCDIDSVISNPSEVTAGSSQLQRLDATELHAKVRLRLTGHEGVVFNIRFSPCGEYCTSVSDDRTIRIWSLKTGEQLRMVYGHEHRIWDCIFLPDGYLASISEDTICRLWHLSRPLSHELAAENGSNELISVTSLRHHVGKGIWCIAQSQNGRFIATGGEDGGLRQYSVRNVIDMATSSSSSTSSSVSAVNEAESESGTSTGIVNLEYDVSQLHEGDFVRTTAQLGTQRLYLSTDYGYIYVVKLDAHNTKEYQHVWQDESIRRFAVLEAAQCTDNFSVLVIGTLTGNLNVIVTDRRTDQVVSQQQLGSIDGKVDAVYIQSDPHFDNSVLVFAHSAKDSSALHWWRIQLNKEGSVSTTTTATDTIITAITTLGQITIPKPTDKYTVSVSKYHIDGMALRYLIAVGSRISAITLFSTAVTGDGASTDVQLLADLRQVHSKLSTTAIHIIGSDATPQQFEMYSAGHDGMIHRFALEFTSHSIASSTKLVSHAVLNKDSPKQHDFYCPALQTRLQVTLLESMQASIGQIGGLHFSAQSAPLSLSLSQQPVLVQHFYKTRFAATELNTRDDILWTSCGGIHRRWQFAHCDNRSVFSYVRKMNAVVAMFENSQDGSSRAPVLLPSVHGRQIRSLCFVGNVLISGCEGGLLQTSIVQNGVIEPVFASRRHRSVVRCIEHIVDANAETMVVTGDGMNQVVVWKLIPQSNALVELACIPHIKRKNGYSDDGDNEDENDVSVSRVMAVAPFNARSNNDDSLVVAAAFSSSSLRLFIIDGHTLKCVAEDDTTAQACILTLVHCVVLGRDVLVAGTTRGELIIWDVNGQSLVNVARFKYIHQSGINALDVARLVEDEATSQLLVATGGDDNAVHVTRLVFTIHSSTLVCEHSIIPVSSGEYPDDDGHSSAVTAISIDASDNSLISTSIDQRIIKWKPSADRDGSIAEYTSQPKPIVIDVADPSAMAVLRSSSTVAIGGVGIQVINI